MNFIATVKEPNGGPEHRLESTSAYDVRAFLNEYDQQVGTQISLVVEGADMDAYAIINGLNP